MAGENKNISLQTKNHIPILKGLASEIDLAESGIY
jgi:hypothetical protein